MKNQSFGKHHNMLCLENTLTVKNINKENGWEFHNRLVYPDNYELRITNYALNKKL